MTRNMTQNTIRKLVLALGASIVIGTAALSPTAASAHGWHHHGWHHGWHHWHHGWHRWHHRYYGCYTVRRVVWTPWGKRIRRVEICN
jgi:hypothetical protein